MNRVTSRVVGVEMKDYGCMLRAYTRQVVEAMNQCRENSSFIPALANSFAQKVVEIPVGHAQRGGGQSKYGLFRLLSLHFDLATGFSVLPIQLVSLWAAWWPCWGLLSAFSFSSAGWWWGRKWKASSPCSPSFSCSWGFRFWAWGS